MKFSALICGGEGPDVWDSEMLISASDFEDAFGQAVAMARERCGYVTQLGESPDYPDIGPDPLKLNGEERNAYRSDESVKARLDKACAIQQKGVPDQTALVWRDDLNQMSTRLILAEARLRNSKSHGP